ncbi:MAG TPA: phosphoglucosamine mutase [Oligoflexia bacterium]|nr:phosphoglucosamine mutase [Oligoflexia bacterium]HMP48610.1 phosphoglucosamine mutase [Oligoflexia bacterium]
MGRLFGTDGIRGVANTHPMDSETALKLGRALANVVKRKSGSHRILIGKDTRISGYMLETALESGISSMGVDVLLVGPLPTPGVAFVTRSMRADAGIMISASHNSYEDNGIKIFDRDGYKLPDDAEDEIENLIMASGGTNSLSSDPSQIGKAFRIEDAIGRYIVFLKNVLPRSCSLEGLKIVVDAANGAAYRVAPQLFFELGVEVVMLADRPNGKNINHECGSLHPEKLVSKVREVGAHVGIAFDGDADRVIFCDEAGQLLDGDDILAMCALHEKSSGRLSGNGVVGTVMSNFGLEQLFKSRNISFCRSDVGDRYVLLEMQERGFALGGEQSGHIIFLDHNTTGDGLLTALKVLTVMQEEGKPLSEYRKLVQRFPQLLINVPVRDKVPFSDIPAVVECLKDSEREIEGQGRILLRYSGTEKKARVMVECESSALCSKVAEQLAKVISDKIGVK